MTDLLSVILPIFILVGVGFVAVQVRLLPGELVQALGSFVLNIALPALVLHALLRQELQETLNWTYLLAYACGSLAAFAAVLLFSSIVLRKPLPHATMAAFGSSASNSGFVGFPVASLALGAPALTALPLSMMVENILVIPLTFVLGEMGLQQGQGLRAVIRQTVRRLSRTPLILAIFIGVAFSAVGIRLPGPVTTALEMAANASAPCALFVIGGTLAGLRVASMAGDVLLIVIGKLVLHPLAVAAAFLLIGGVERDLIAAGIILAAAPMVTIYPIIGARFSQGDMCAAALLTATVVSFFTMIVVLGLVLS